MIESGNLFGDIPAQLPAEHVTRLVAASNIRIERIVSHGHTSPADFWYDQEWPEWVLVLTGSAAILFEGEAQPRMLKRGDHVHIPAHVRHRVVRTDSDEPTVWLAVHYR